MTDRVYLQSVPDYDQARVDAAIEYILHNCSLDALVTEHSRVVLKVNLLMKSNPDSAVTTHPAVVCAVVKSLQARGVREIIVADSPSGAFTMTRLNSIYAGCGMTAAAELGATLNQDLSSVSLQTESAANPSFDVLKVVRNADLVIGIAKLKTHSLTGISGAVKNYFGVVPGLEKPQYHFRYPEKSAFGGMLCDLYEALQPDISLLDAVVGMEGNGPSGGTPRTFGFLAGGQNAHHIDRVACYLIGVDPRLALTVQTGIARGLVPADMEDITIKGDFALLANPLGDLKLPKSLDSNLTNHLPKPIRAAASNLMYHLCPVPVIRKKDCTGCGRCAESCAPKAVTVRGRKAQINRRDCIRCFCCHEVCPARAIDIEQNFVFKVIK